MYMLDGRSKGHYNHTRRVLATGGPPVVPGFGTEYLTLDLDPRGLDPWGYFGILLSSIHSGRVKT